MGNKPTLGRIVLVCVKVRKPSAVWNSAATEADYELQYRPAVIFKLGNNVSVFDGDSVVSKQLSAVSLQVFGWWGQGDCGSNIIDSAEYSEDMKENTWRWPPREVANV